MNEKPPDNSDTLDALEKKVLKLTNSDDWASTTRALQEYKDAGGDTLKLMTKTLSLFNQSASLSSEETKKQQI